MTETKDDEHHYYDLQNEKIIFKTFLYEGFILTVSIFIILLIISEIIGIMVGIIEYQLNYIELIIIILFLGIVTSFIFIPCTALTIIIIPSILLLRKKIGVMNVSRCNIVLSKDNLMFNFTSPILNYPMIYPYHGLLKQKIISNKIPLSFITDIVPLNKTNDSHQKNIINKIRIIRFYKKPGTMHLSGVDRDDIFRIELVKEMNIYNYNLHNSYIFPPKPIKTKYIYFTIDKEQINDFLNVFKQNKRGIVSLMRY